MTELDEPRTTPHEGADPTSADEMADGLARIDAALGRGDAIEESVEYERQNAIALTPVWMRLIALLESAPPLPQSEVDAVTLSKAIASDLRNSACPIGKLGSLSTKA
jgi:hypothetical protein